MKFCKECFKTTSALENELCAKCHEAQMLIFLKGPKRYRKVYVCHNCDQIIKDKGRWFCADCKRLKAIKEKMKEDE